MEELREAFDQFGWLLSAAVPAPKSRVDAGYDVKKIAKVLDFINVMTYDLHGSWDGFAGNFQFLRNIKFEDKDQLGVDCFSQKF